MQCPKCGGEIPFYHLKPNCEHCGVNIMYYTQEEGLTRDAKRTELEGAVARMVIARVKAEFIGSKLAIIRLACSVLAVAALLVPFASVKYAVPFFNQTLSVGIIGIIQGFTSGLILKVPQFLSSAVFAKQTLAAVVPAAFLVIIVLIDAAIVVGLLLGFLNLTKGANFMKKTALVGVAVSIVAQIAVVVMKFTAPDSSLASVSLGFGALAAAAMFLVLYFLNRAMLKAGIEPQYKENDLKRRDLLKKVRAGEVNLDDLPLPVFESEDEHEARMQQLQEALQAEEEGKEL